MSMLKGITIELCVRTEVGTNDFNAPVYSEEWISVDNVLVSPVSYGELINNTDLHGKKDVFSIAIPKGDTHKWTDTKVRFFNRTFSTFGDVREGIEAMVPTDWHKQVMVERYE